MTSMDLDTASEFAKDHHRAVMTTNRLDGTPQMSPILVGIDTERRLLISTRTTAMKVTNLERDPRAYLCVMSDEFYGPWVQLSGTTEIIRLPGAMDLLISYYRDLSGEHPGLGRIPGRDEARQPLHPAHHPGQGWPRTLGLTARRGPEDRGPEDRGPRDRGPRRARPPADRTTWHLRAHGARFAGTAHAPP